MTADAAIPTVETIEPPLIPDGPAVGALGIALIGGGVAAALGLFLTLPLFRRRSKVMAAGKAKVPSTRRPRGSRAD